MARDKEEELLDLPEFDKVEFIRSERNRAKAVVIFFLLGAGTGLLAGYLFDIGMWYFSVLILFVFILFFRIIMNALNLEMPKTSGQKLFLVMEYILTFIIFWILFMNAPFSVASGVQTSNVQVDHNGTWLPLTVPQGQTDIYALNGSVFSNVPSSLAFNVTLSYAYNITDVVVSISLYKVGSSQAIRNNPNVSLNFVQFVNYGYYVYFTAPSSYYPSYGDYLQIQIGGVSNGKSIAPSTFKVILPILA